jgi:hypothetical protein
MRRVTWFGLFSLASLSALVVAWAASPAATEGMTSRPFAGAKVNGGTVTLTKNGENRMLTLSADFKTPDTPDPHWQVVDAKGNSHLLQRLTIKGDKMNRSIELPRTVADVAKVQIWCAFAETLLGEAAFEMSETPMK